MSIVLRSAAASSGMRPSWAGGATAALMRWWAAYTSWRLERLAMSRLGAMSDRQLRDIGIVRSEIEFAVRCGTRRSRV